MYSRISSNRTTLPTTSSQLMRYRKYLISAGKYLATLCALVFLGCLTIQFSILQHIKFPVIRKEVNVANNEDLFTASQYGTRFQVGFGYPDNYDIQYDNNRRHTERLKAVVIVASFRTGSSFVGQLFNQHPGVFYLFEPLFYSIWQRPSGLPDSQVIEDVLLCNTTSMVNENHRAWTEARRDLSEDRSMKNFKKMKEIERCLIGGLCFRHKSEALCTRETCRNETVANCRFCAAPSPSLMQEACEHSRVRVLKVIRVEDLETLKRSWNHMNIDLRIIHLVRDPRSTLLSRLRLTKPASNVADVVSSTCERNYKIHSQFLGNETRHRWLKGIYKLVRYEDIIENPVLQARKLYDFLNFLDFKLDKKVIKWIENSIGSTDFSLFGTSRNLEMQKYKWRRQIPLRFAISVQEKCSEMMAMFGYKNVTSNIQLLNMGVPLMAELH